MNPDVVVIGGGTVGASIAYGLARRGIGVSVVDGTDHDFRAATANFGLVWQHGKGMGMPAYQRLTRSSVAGWSEFASELSDIASINLQLEQHGGLVLCLGEDGVAAREGTLRRLHNQFPDETPDWEMIDRRVLMQMLPDARLGEEVSGASFGRQDGQVNPLRLLAALRSAIIRLGGTIRAGAPVHSLKRQGSGYVVEFGDERLSTTRVVIAAGLGSKAIAAQVGLDLAIRPQRGQILVTERVVPFLPLPTMDVRQTGEGTIMIGSTHEEVGLDASTTGNAAGALSAEALRYFPAIARARLVRQWAGLRIMTPDGYPIYEQAPDHPGVFVAQCHSGVTLAAVHTDAFADAVIAGRLPDSFEAFHQGRFDVSQAA